MCLLHFAQLGLYIYALTESILKRALQKSGFHKYPFEVLNIEEGTILEIDRYGFLTCSTFEVQESFRFGKWYNWYDELEEEYYSQQEELLLEMCNCYGVTEDDVLLLLDYGYSADEIEEMLCDSNLLLETLCAVRCEEEFCCEYTQKETAFLLEKQFLFSIATMLTCFLFHVPGSLQDQQHFSRSFRSLGTWNTTSNSHHKIIFISLSI